MRTLLNRLDVLTGSGVVRCPAAFAFARTQLRLESGQTVGNLRARRDPDGSSLCDARAVASVCACSRMFDDVVARRANAAHAFRVTLAIGSAAECSGEDRQSEHSVGSIDQPITKQDSVSALTLSVVWRSSLHAPPARGTRRADSLVSRRSPSRLVELDDIAC